MALCLSFSIFAVAGYASAQDISLHDQQQLLAGGKQMVEGNKKAIDIMTKKGIKDPDLAASEKKMNEGYDMMTQGQSMMQGGKMAEGKQMMMQGASMMVDANKITKACAMKHEMGQECAGCLDECTAGQTKIKAVFQSHGLQGNWESGL
jgi:hypothetical protein